MKTDIREFSDNELSLIVMNDEYLYKKRHQKGFFDLIDELFLYNEDQIQTLKEDLELDLEEMQADEELYNEEN